MAPGHHTSEDSDSVHELSAKDRTFSGMSDAYSTGTDDNTDDGAEGKRKGFRKKRRRSIMIEGESRRCMTCALSRIDCRSPPSALSPPTHPQCAFSRAAPTTATEPPSLPPLSPYRRHGQGVLDLG